MLKNKRKLLTLCLFSVALNGCAGIAPVPGGNQTVNESFYTTNEDLLSRLNSITPGMTEEQVFTVMDHTKDQFEQLTRAEILTALTGSSNVEMHGGENPQYEQSLIQSLSGYRLEYKTVKRRHGFSSPIRIKTDEKGYDYFVTFVFRNGVLFEKPIVSGGLVNASSSKTFFDYLNPGSVMDRVIQ